MFRMAFALVVSVGLVGGVASAADDEYVYSQKTGKLTLGGKLIATGYSGHGDGVNNPDKEKMRNVGPIPAGLWTLSKPRTYKKMENCFDLTPSGHDAHGRDQFLIHGDNDKGDKSASEGCIILDKAVRLKIADGKVTKLRVVKE